MFSTLHTLDATETISRIISVFPPHQQRQIRIQLSTVLKAAVSQRLMPRADGLGRVPAVEVMIATPFIRDCIVDKDRTNHIHGAIASGTSQYGMQTFDQSIFSLYQQGFVTLDEAMRWASNLDEFKLKVQGISTTAEHGARRNGQAGRRPAGHHPVWRLTPGASAYLDALHLLSRRALTVAECRERLLDREHPDDKIDTAIDAPPRDRRPRRQATGARHTRARRSRSRAAGACASCASSRPGASTRTSRPKPSPRSSARRTSGRSSPGRSQKKLRGRGRGPPTPPSQARLYQYLMRQGFTPAVVIEALRRLRRGLTTK